MKYYLVAPLSYIGSKNELLTYCFADNLSIGQLVNIPLREKKIIGVVVDVAVKPDFVTKEITGTVFDKPVLDANLMKLVFWMSDYYGSSLSSVLQTMIPSGLTKKRRTNEKKETTIIKDEPLPLTLDQEKIFDEISSKHGQKHLIFGVTGSGKTEIYLQLIEKVISGGQQAIMLVPEVSLTPQTMERFQRRFGEKVVLLHSYLKETERFKSWKAIFDGEKTVIVGTRSALFAPCSNLGLIIIDEEHESSYKQDKTPKYQTITVAEKLSDLTGCTLVLGSATPSLTSFYKARKDYNLHSLYKRIVQSNLPPVEIIDMRDEFKSGNKTIFSERLQELLKETLKNKQQVILFLNRRGMSTFVSCRDCGYVDKCPNCDLPLTFHLDSKLLKCHHCGFKKNIPIVCPVCKSMAIKFFGAGTQKVEQELSNILGNRFSIARMDKDTTKQTGSHQVLYNSFAQKRADILVGTQMITKGLDLENVGLVGIISADTIINFPDYTANEKTFDLLTQVAGRTGRGSTQGRVVIQTYNPDNMAVRYASKHDYLGFYEKEIENRKELTYPPFAKLIKLTYNNFDQNVAENKAREMREELEIGLKNIPLKILGPSPAFIPKIGNRYYYQITLKLLTATEEKLIETVKIIKDIVKHDWSIDVEPGDLI